jgi:hypothetical protein
MAVGVLNVVFGSMLLFFNLTQVAGIAMMPMISRMMGGWNSQMQTMIEAERAQELRRLREQLEGAQTDEEKANLEQRIDRAEARPAPQSMDLGKMYEWMASPTFSNWSWFDLITSAVTNILWIIFGARLIAKRETGRKGSIVTSILKIARGAVSQTIYIIVVVPVMSKGISDAMQEMIKASPGGGGPPFNMGMVLGVTYTVTAIMTLIGGSVYPVISWWLLTRPRVKAAMVDAKPAASSS